MGKTFHQVKIELGGGARKKLKPLYIFANCPSALFRNLISLMREKLGRKTEVVNIMSTKESIEKAFFSGDFFSERKIVVFDFELISPSRAQISEMLRVPESGENKNILVIRSEKKPVPREIREKANSLGTFYWINWKYDDIISTLKADFPDVKFMEDAERMLKYAISVGIDIGPLMEKAVLYAYPRRYIGKEDILRVLPPEGSPKLKNFSVDVLSGELGNFPMVERSEDINSVLSAFSSQFLTLVKLRLRFNAEKNIRKFVIESEMKTRNVDGILRTLRGIKNTGKITEEFSDMLERTRVGILPPSFYFFKFAFDLAREVKK